MIASNAYLLAFKYCGLFLILGSIAQFGDKVLERNVQSSIVVRAAIDNFTHFLLGAFSWVTVITSQVQVSRLIAEILLCGFLSSLIDIDHFIAAQSFSLKDAVNLPTRPPFHNTTAMVIVSISLILFVPILDVECLERLGWIFLVAVITHHLRDGLRHGLWIWPYGSSKPIDWYLYLCITCIFPLICRLLIKAISNELG